MCMRHIAKIIKATVAAAALAAGMSACGATVATAEKIAHEHPIKAVHKELRTEFDQLTHDHPIKAARTELRLEMSQWGVREATPPPCEHVAIGAAPDVKD